MATNVHKFNGNGIRVPVVTADPSSPENGMMWYNSTDNVFRKYENGTTSDLGSGSDASDIAYDNGASGLLATDVQAAIDELTFNQDEQTHLRALTGTSEGDEDLGIFSGSIIADNSTIKAALQALETETELKAYESSVFLKDGSTEMTGAINGGGFKVTNIDDPTANSDAATKGYVDSNFVETSLVGANNGVASLDAGGKIPASQLPSTVMEFKGTWLASTNSPTLTDGTGDAGDVYIVSTPGTVNFGSGDITFDVGDWVVYSGTEWQRSINSNSVVSVNGQQGVVSIDTDDVSEGGTNLYFTPTRAQTAAVVNTLAGSETTQAPSVNAVNAALANKLESVEDDTAPVLGGNLSVGTNVILQGASGVRIGDASNFFETQYFNALTLTASQTDSVESSLSFAHASHEGLIVEYKIKEASTNRIRVGTLHVVTNGTDSSVVDTFTETGDVGVTWSLNISGATLQVRYSTTSNNKTMRAIAKRLKA